MKDYIGEFIGKRCTFQFSGMIGDTEVYGLEAVVLFLYANPQMVRELLYDKVWFEEQYGDESREMSIGELIHFILELPEVVKIFTEMSPK